MANSRNRLAFETAHLPSRSGFLGGHNSWHLMLVTGGSCEEEAGRVHDLTPGCVRLSSPRERHRLFTGSDGLDCTLFLVPERWVAEAVPMGNLFLRDDRIEALLRRESGVGRDPATSLRRDLDVRMALAHLAAAARGKNISPAPSWIEDTHFALSGDGAGRVDAIARSAKVTREHLARTFARYYGCSPAEYRSAHKLLCAVGLLRGSDMPIADVAHAAGFSDQSHLTRALSARFGQTPARLRRERTTVAAPSGSASRNSPAR
jgi:AraC-like DNA-binding protein